MLKFLRPASLGTGRFDKTGIPAPAFFSALDGIFEIGCGVLILIGLLTRSATVPMVIDMLGALFITKAPIFWGHAPLFRGEHGWWDFIHESRVDLAQLCGSLFLLIVGNDNPIPFVWTKTAEQILQSIQRLMKLINGAGH